jgi:signal transduction histidine kinase
MKSRLSFRGNIIFLFIGSMVPLLVFVGLVVYGLQRISLLDRAETNLADVVGADIKQVQSEADLSQLAANLSAHLRTLGADVFLMSNNGSLIAPSLGSKPWLDTAAYQAVLHARKSLQQTIGNGAAARMVDLEPVLDSSGNLLGSVEASLPMLSIADQLAMLRTSILVGLMIAVWFIVALSIPISGIITRPMITLVESVANIRKGNLETRAKIPEVYELGQLALTYNQMLDRISEELRNQAQLAETMRRFAADASHELRSPLTVFRNSVDLLKKASEQNDQKSIADILAILPKETDVMAGLVENLLLLARLDQSLEAATALLHREEVPPFPLMEEVYERSLLLAKGQHIELIWPQGEVAPIWADREMLRRALNNIVENAITYTPAGKKITLSLESGEGSVAFIIADQGCGISPEKLSRIFERFYRGDEARNRQTTGTGLGLAIVATIVRVHGGEIQVESTLDEGTRFRLVLKQQAAPPLEA